MVDDPRKGDDGARDATVLAESETPSPGSPAPTATDANRLQQSSRHATPGSAPARIDEHRQVMGEAAVDSDNSDIAGLPVIESDRYVFGYELARGGMGRIFVVRDRNLGRKIAIKELLVSSDALKARFYREIQLTSRLQHPAIVNVHEAGRWSSGEPFYAMKLVEGKPLKKVIAASDTLAERIALVPKIITIVEALAYAHKQGIIHRDLKPSNVLVGDFGETVVIDWGLAKDLNAKEVRTRELGEASTVAGKGPAMARSDSASGDTLAGSVLGTPGYMAPEQARGDTVGREADVYALGAILYASLCGRAPHRGDTATAVLESVRSSPVVPLAEIEPNVPEDLNAIVTKALEYAPGDRYQSAGELADDLRRFRNGKLVVAHNYTSRELLSRWIRRHQTGVVVALVAIAVLAVGAVVSVRGIAAQRDRAEAAQQRAMLRADAMTVLHARSRAKSDPAGALRILTELSLDSAQWPAAKLVATQAAIGGLPTVVAKLADESSATAVSPSEFTIALGYEDGRVELITESDPTPRLLIRANAAVHQLAFSASGEHLAVSSHDATIRLVSVKSKLAITLVNETGRPTSTFFSPNGSRIGATTLSGQLTIWNAKTGAVVLGLAGVQKARFVGDGSIVAVLAEEPTTLERWDLATDTKRTYAPLPYPIRDIAAGADGGWVAAIGTGRKVHVYDDDGKANDLGEHSADLEDVEAALSGSLLATASADGVVRIWDRSTGEGWNYHASDGRVRADGRLKIDIEFSADARYLVAEVGGTAHIVSVARRNGRAIPNVSSVIGFSPDNKSLIVWDGEARLIRWPTESTNESRVTLKGPAFVRTLPAGRGYAAASRTGSVLLSDGRTLEGPPSMEDLVISRDGFLLAGLGNDKRVRLWDLETGARVALPGRASGSLSFNKIGSTLIAAGDGTAIHVWDVASGALRSLSMPGGWAYAVGFALGDEAVVSTTIDGHLTVSSLKDTSSRVLGVHGASVLHLAVFDDFAVSAGVDGRVLRWPLGSGEAELIASHGSIVSAFASSDSGVIASADGQGAISVAELGSVSKPLKSGDSRVTALALSANGETLASGHVSGRVFLWNVASGESVELFGPTAKVADIAVAADGRSIVAASDDGTVYRWFDPVPSDPAEIIDWIENAIGQ